MERVLQVINRMQADGIIEKYAIGGGIAAVYYIEPYQTDDLNIFIPVSAVTVDEVGLLSLESIYSYLAKLGYKAVKEGVLIEDWLVQFIPASESTQEERCATRKLLSTATLRLESFLLNIWLLNCCARAA